MLGGIRGGELLAAFGALLLAVFVLLFVVSLKLASIRKPISTAAPVARTHRELRHGANIRSFANHSFAD